MKKNLILSVLAACGLLADENTAVTGTTTAIELTCASEPVPECPRPGPGDDAEV